MAKWYVVLCSRRSDVSFLTSDDSNTSWINHFPSSLFPLRRFLFPISHGAIFPNDPTTLNLDLPGCSGGDRLRLICMGRGMLMPDTRTLEDCQIPVFKTHPTPVNVSVKPEAPQVESAKNSNEKNPRANTPGSPAGDTGEQTSQGCACVIL
jgi:hypothetical protein